MAHKFDISKRNRLESEERKRLLAPSETLRRLGYQKGGTMADIGCGTGLFTFPAAERGGNEAKIYAVDVSEEMLSEVKKRAEAAGSPNIITVKSGEYDFKLTEGSADFVLICAVLHEIDDQARFLREGARICRKGGKIAVIEFNHNVPTDFGPPLDHRMTKEQVRELILSSGFHTASAVDISEAFYAVAALKA